MEDDKSTETSTNEEAFDVEAELEESEINFDTEGDSDSEEQQESEESDEDESANESTDETEEDSKDDVNDEEGEQEAPADPNAERKAAQEAYEKRKAAREQAKRDAQADFADRGYQEAYEQAIKDGKDERTARHEASEALTLRQLQVDAYNNRIQGNTNRLQNDMDKATARIDLFRSKDPEVKEALLEAIDDFERMHVKLDRNGDPVDVTGNLYDFLQKRAERISKLTSVGARKQERDKGKTRARTIAKPSRAPKKSEQDPDLEAFDEEANRW